jgi:hypothetical protein
VRVVFTEDELGATCSSRQQVAARWGRHAADVELALCTLKNSRDLRRFLAIPNVTQEDNEVTFTALTSTVHLVLAEIALNYSRPCVAVRDVRVTSGQHG